MTDWKTLRQQVLSNPETAEEYERLRPQFELASQLITLRKELGLTQRELANLAGVTQPEIARIESGKISPRWDKVINLLRSVGASVQIVPPKRQQFRLVTAGAGSTDSVRHRSAGQGRFASSALTEARKTKSYGRQSAGTRIRARGGTSEVSKKNPNVHTAPRESGGWANQREGASRASSTHDTKAQAVAAGRQIAKNAGVEHLIHNKDGKIAERNSYGRDPHPPKG
jgi:transcriptional regulator with XRE-family HTH domain